MVEFKLGRVDIGKIEKAAPDDLRVITKRSALRTKVLSLMPGEAFTVTGLERDVVANVAYAISKSEGWKVKTHKVEPLKFRLVRIK